MKHRSALCPPKGHGLIRVLRSPSGEQGERVGSEYQYRVKV
jgi:hypothetical protein